MGQAGQAGQSQRRPSGVDVESLADPTARPDEHAEAGERDRQLRAALARLGADQRQILVLRDYLDLSYAEIAAVLDVAPGTVMSRLHRSRMALKTELESGND